MEAFICPECGGRVDPPTAGSEYAKCSYCATSFRVDRAVPLFHNAPATTVDDIQTRAAPVVVVVVVVAIVAAGVIFATFRTTSVRTPANNTVNTVQKAQETANYARLAANAVQRSADEMVNKAQRTALANSTPSPTPGRRPTSK